VPATPNRSASDLTAPARAIGNPRRRPPNRLFDDELEPALDVETRTISAIFDTLHADCSSTME